MNDLKDRILDLDIVTTIGAYIDLKPSGSNYKGLCPIHGEKTPSFMVSPAKNIWKCFGCGKGGNIIDFVIEKKGLSFIDALHLLARENNIEIPREEHTPEQRKTDDHNEALMTVNAHAVKWFREQLYKKENKAALDYALSRWSPETVKLWDIGFAPDEMAPHAYTTGMKKEILIESGLIKESSRSNGQFFNIFRNRLIIPVHNKYGRVIALTGRDMSGKEDAPKYINSPETDIYTKGSVLFGLHQAQKTIRQKGFCYLVEGNPDVIRLHDIEINNTVASAGTSLTIDQVIILKSLCKSVNIIGDSDPAGLKAVKRSAELLIKHGLPVNIVSLPSGDKKEDPDSFFKSEKQFKEYLEKEGEPKDYIFILAEEWKKKANNPDFKAKAVNEISELIVQFEDPSMHVLYIEQLGKILPPKKAWADKVKSLLKENEPVPAGDELPKGVDAAFFVKYGFYEKNNCYHFRTSKGIIPGCNFKMKPLFHIPSIIRAKRLYEIVNEFGFSEIIEFLQSDLIAISKFKERVESLGNFRWFGGEPELNKLKRYLYEQTETCIEITQLGWQKYGFYAWSNGIFDGVFTKTDDFGIVRFNDKNYYLPASSSIYKNEDLLYMSERRFIHREGVKTSLHEYSSLLIEVFGDNATIAICFYIASLFRDYIVRINNFFPILNLFGPKGTGKTELAVSIMQFFGRQAKGPNINNTTKPALADHVAQHCNACDHIDEYKNNIEFEKIEFLKGLWDGTGRTRMNMEKDKKKETTAVDVGIILSGQEMPTADIAFFSRLVFLSFYKTEYSDQEKAKFNHLKELEKKGLTHITHEILQHRKLFLEKYRDFYDHVSEDMIRALKGEVIEDRIFRNWIVILAAYATIESKLELPFTYKNVIKQACMQIRVQNKETKKSSEISTFWRLVQYLYSDGLIQEDVDYKIDRMQQRLKTDLVDVVWSEPKNIIYMQYSRIIPLYRKHGKMHGETVLPSDSIDYYLRNDRRFLGKKRNVNFKVINPKTGMEEMDSEGRKKRKVTNAYAFIYNDLDITLHSETEEGDLFNPHNKEEKPIFNTVAKEDLPY